MKTETDQARADIIRNKIESTQNTLKRAEIENNLRNRRERLGFTIEEIAHHSRIGYTTVQELETGHYWPSLDKARRIAKVLGVSIEYLWPED